MISFSSAALYPEARSDATIAPAEVPARLHHLNPCDSNEDRAPTRAIPLTPPPSNTPSAMCPVGAAGPWLPAILVHLPRRIYIRIDHSWLPYSGPTGLDRDVSLSA